MPQRLSELAEVAYAALSDDDLAGFLAVVDDEVEFRSLVAEIDGRHYKGHEGVREWWDSVAVAMGGLRFEPVEVHDHGPSGYVELSVTATISGVVVTQRMWQAVRLRDGRAIWWATFRSEAEAREAIGLSG